jgi:Protein of unknown function (DUF1292).
MTDKEKDMIDGETDTIVFADDEGNEIEFTEVAYFEHGGKNYSALSPADPKNDEEAGELIFCEVTEDTEGYESFNLVDDEKLLEELFNEFFLLRGEEECECGCDGHEHGDGCDCGCD